MINLLRDVIVDEKFRYTSMRTKLTELSFPPEYTVNKQSCIVYFIKTTPFLHTGKNKRKASSVS